MDLVGAEQQLDVMAAVCMIVEPGGTITGCGAQGATASGRFGGNEQPPWPGNR